MGFDEAVEAHKAWKAKLAYIRSPDGSLTHSTVSDDTACDLGKWICGDARTACADRREYLELQIAHAPFHLGAGKVIGQVDCGEEIPEEVLVGPSSPYAIASRRAVSRILRAEKRFPG
jgi:hypothetical protein